MPTIDRDGPVVFGKWLRYQPELLVKFLRGMELWSLMLPCEARPATKLVNDWLTSLW